MKKNTFFKMCFREIKLSLSRFIAIIAIVALGTGFLIGLLSTTPDLYASVDAYYDSSNTADIFIKSNVLFNEDDVEIIGQMSEVLDVVPYYEEDKKVSILDQTVIGRYISTPLNNQKINKLKLISGNYPTNNKECLIEQANGYLLEASIGDVISIGNEKIKITGIVQNPWYFSKFSEPSTLGSGRIETIIYMDHRFDTNRSITDIHVTLNNTKELNTFKKKYEQEVDNFVAKLSLQATSRALKQEENLKALAREAIYEEIVEKSKIEIKEQLIQSGITTNLDYLVEQVLSSTDFIDKTNTLVDIELAKLFTLEPTWFILTRQSNPSFYNFKMNASKVDAIAAVFPIFFYLVAALIALSTITRMVEADRLNIGTLKALGYQRKNIFNKYSLYVLLSCAIGSILGICLGIALLPMIIYKAYESIFFLPPLKLQYEFWMITIAVLGMIFTILLVTTLVCRQVLKEKPAALMLGRSPQPGKRIFLEKLPFIWRKLKFKYKSSIRNVFRYKKNLIIMILGVGGCTALLLVAFGMYDSIQAVAKTQYQEIFNYQMIINSKEDTQLDFSNYDINSSINAYLQVGKAKASKEIKSTLISADNNLSDFVTFRQMNGKSLVFSENSVIITYQIAKELSLKVGDRFDFVFNNQSYNDLCVSGITENYVENYIYIHSNKLAELSLNLVKKNAYLANVANLSNDEQQFLTEQLLQIDGIISIDSTTIIMQSYQTLLDNMIIIIIVLILCSGALAVIVIYNLTNISIEERIKEIATLKVLGYQRKEVAGYIFRETLIMTIMGSLVGLLVGKVFHVFVVTKIENIGLVFGQKINSWSFVIAFVLSIVFTIIVDIFFVRKINKIKMVESLKCIE